MFSILAINHCRACMKESVSILQVHSICTALLAKHVKSVPYLLSSFLLSFMRNGPNISMPQLVNGGPSKVLSFGRSAIFCSPSFPHSNLHLTHFPIRLLTIVLHWTTQKQLLLISFIVSLLPPCATFLWHYSTINLGMLPSLPSNTGWTSLTCRFDFFSLPPTLNKPFLSMYGMGQGYICHFFYLMIFCHLHYYPLGDLFLYQRLATDAIW